MWLKVYIHKLQLLFILSHTGLVYFRADFDEFSVFGQKWHDFSKWYFCIDHLKSYNGPKLWKEPKVLLKDIMKIVKMAPKWPSSDRFETNTIVVYQFDRSFNPQYFSDWVKNRLLTQFLSLKLLWSRNWSLEGLTVLWTEGRL